MMNNIYDKDISDVIKINLPWVKLKRKSILITGANGFIPSFITNVLMKLNKENNLGLNVFCLVRNKAKADVKFHMHKNESNFNLLIQDVNEPLKDNKNPFDVIIHSASKASPKYYKKDPAGTILPNVLGTYNLLEYSRNNNVSDFIYISSSEIYGRIDNIKKIKEDDYGYLNPLEIRSCYGESKRMGETLCIAWFKRYNVPVKIVRLFHTYGPGMDLSDGRVFADFVSDVVENKDILIKSNGKAKRAFCYITDAVEGIFTILFRGSSGEAYNLGNEKGEISVNDLAKMLINMFQDKNLKVIHKPRQKSDNYLPSGVDRVCPDTSKIKKLGWNPKVDLWEGFNKAIRSYSNEPSS